MAETPTLLPSDQPADPQVYRPLSWLALAAFMGAGAYALGIAVVTVVAFSTGTPLFLGLGTLVIPVATAILAYVARQQIRSSEGVLGGMALVRWAGWFSVLFGLGFTAYYVGTYLAVSLQAEKFTTQWLEKLRAGKVNQAFWDTLEPGKRKFDKPEDPEYMFQHYGAAMAGRKGPLGAFQDNTIIRILQMAGQEGSITSLGVKNWDYENGGYKVEGLYRITTLEGVYEMVVPVRGIQGKEIEGRQWQVLAGNAVLSGQTVFSDLGKILGQCRSESRQFAAQWLLQREQGKAAEAVPIQTEGFQALKKDREGIVHSIQTKIQNPSVVSMKMSPEGQSRLVLPVDKEKGPVRILHEVQLGVYPKGRETGEMPLYSCDAAVIVESDPGPLVPERARTWHVAGIQLIRGGEQGPEPSAKPGGPPAGGR